MIIREVGKTKSKPELVWATPMAALSSVIVTVTGGGSAQLDIFKQIKGVNKALTEIQLYGLHIDGQSQGV